MRTIARTAGVTPAMINYYFGGKQALHDALVAEAQARLHARLAAAVAGGPSAARLAEAYFDFLVDERQMQQLLLREVIDGQTEGFGELIRPLRQLLVDNFDGDDDAVQSALSLFGAVAGYFIYAPVLDGLVGEDPLSPGALERRRKHVVDLASTIEERHR